MMKALRGDIGKTRAMYLIAADDQVASPVENKLNQSSGIGQTCRRCPLTRAAL